MQEGDWGWDAQESGCSGVRMLRDLDDWIDAWGEGCTKGAQGKGFRRDALTLECRREVSGTGVQKGC